MAAAMKLFLVIVAFVCCMQFVEMARVPRDEPAAPAFDFSAQFQEFVKTVESSDLMKQLKEIKPEEVQGKFQDGLKTLQENLSGSKDKIENLAKDIIESFNKNMAPAKSA